MNLRFFGLCAAGALVAICPCYAATLTAADEYYTTPENASLLVPSGGLLANDTTPNLPLEVFLVTPPSDGALEIPAASLRSGVSPLTASAIVATVGNAGGKPSFAASAWSRHRPTPADVGPRWLRSLTFSHANRTQPVMSRGKSFSSDR